MKVVRSVKELKILRRTMKDTVGFVPTMGALHQGHLRLIEEAVHKNRQAIVSIFINPAQFDQKSDLETYPSHLESDIQALKNSSVDVLFAPDEAEMYPNGYAYKVTENELSKKLCGSHRPGHFDGVLTVVLKLIHLVKPTSAYFGEKDYQQLQLIQQMVNEFFLDTKIVGVPIVREADGLAMSSRNINLSSDQRRNSSQLYYALSELKTDQDVRKHLENNGFEIEYIEELKGRRLAAVRMGSVRLIDNVPIDSK